MSTKVFSARLNEELIQKIKQLSLARGQSIQDVLNLLLENSLENFRKEQDPWTNFAGSSADLFQNEKEFEQILKQKRAKNQKLRELRKTNLEIDSQ